MTLKAVYLTREEIPAAYVDLFSEKDGQFELTGIEGIKTEADIDRITTAYSKRIKDAAQRVKGSDEITPESIKTMIADAIAEGSAGSGSDDIDGGDIPTGVQNRLSKLERDLAAATQQATEFKTEAETAKAQALETALTSQLSAAAAASGIRPEAIDHFVSAHKGDFEINDGKLVRKFVEGDPKTASESVQDYLLKRKTDQSTAYFWPTNEGGGSRGGSGNPGPGGKNPFSKENWNVTEQNAIYNSDPERAKQFADQAGVDVITGLPKKG